MTYRLAAKFYDLFGSKDDLEFYKELALHSGGEALELGVGTARVAIALAKVGVTVVGIDNSVHMLRVAREELAKESEAVRRRVARARKLLERYHECGEVAILSKDEIIRMLEETGFQPVCVCGDFDKSEYRKGGSKTVLVTKRE